jgi:hypothetical protein
VLCTAPLRSFFRLLRGLPRHYGGIFLHILLRFLTSFLGPFADPSPQLGVNARRYTYKLELAPPFSPRQLDTSIPPRTVDFLHEESGSELSFQTFVSFLGLTNNDLREAALCLTRSGMRRSLVPQPSHLVRRTCLYVRGLALEQKMWQEEPI